MSDTERTDTASLGLWLAFGGLCMILGILIGWSLHP